MIESLGKQIVILQRGWVMVGDLYRENFECTLKNASVIRRWGTTEGLGQIAEHGPTQETVLDKCALPIKFHWVTVIASLECDPKMWR